MSTLRTIHAALLDDFVLALGTTPEAALARAVEKVVGCPDPAVLDVVALSGPPAAIRRLVMVLDGATGGKLDEELAHVGLDDIDLPDLDVDDGESATA